MPTLDIGSDDWRGEHFIKSPKPSIEMKPCQKPTKRKSPRLCKATGCGRYITRNSKHGLCDKHKHHLGICQCKICLNPSPQRLVEIQKEKGNHRAN